MHVYDISDATFVRFARDLLNRINDTAPPIRPLMWVSIGNSGAQVVREILKIGTNSQYAWWSDIRIVQLQWNPTTSTHEFSDEADAKILADAPVILFDSVVNSGTTMLNAFDLVSATNPRPRSIVAYSIAVRHGAHLIPNFFALAIGQNDRLFLPWQDERPNSRLNLLGIYRSLREADLSRNPIESTQSFINRVEWSDRWYSLKKESNRRIILCDAGERIAGFVNFVVDSTSNELHIDEIATDIKYERKGIAGALLRYSETFGRAAECKHMSLWSHDTVVSYYEKMSFEKQGPRLNCGKDGEYFLMQRMLGSSKQELQAWTNNHR